MASTPILEATPSDAVKAFDKVRESATKAKTLSGQLAPDSYCAQWKKLTKGPPHY